MTFNIKHRRQSRDFDGKEKKKNPATVRNKEMATATKKCSLKITFPLFEQEKNSLETTLALSEQY